MCREIVTGKPSPLNSSFKLSYYTLLNLLRRVENSGHDQEHVISRSFNQFQFERSLPEVWPCACHRAKLVPRSACASSLQHASGLGQRHACFWIHLGNGASSSSI